MYWARGMQYQFDLANVHTSLYEISYIYHLLFSVSVILSSVVEYFVKTILYSYIHSWIELRQKAAKT